jgi:hypothetical protein
MPTEGESMEKSDKASYLRRRLSQLKVLTRLFEHELDLGKGDEIVFDRHLIENALDTLEVFIEDAEATIGGKTQRTLTEKSEVKPQVTRLN